MFGHDEIIDSILKDGLWDPYNDCAMGSCGEILSKEKYTIEMQNEFAIKSYEKSIDAIELGNFKDEIVGSKLKIKNKFIFNTDEEPLKFNKDKLKQLKPAFKKMVQ